VLQPVVKWSGSKRRVAPRLAALFPECRRFFDPFLGSGSLLPYATGESPTSSRPSGVGKGSTSASRPRWCVRSTHAPGRQHVEARSRVGAGVVVGGGHTAPYSLISIGSVPISKRGLPLSNTNT
jgi:hypothetical protein